jgi:hypothetical protein
MLTTGNIREHMATCPNRHEADTPSMDHVELASLGGKARAESMTAEERRESARKAADARWEKVRRAAKKLKPGRKKS